MHRSSFSLKVILENMPKNILNIIVWDYETSGLSPDTSEVIQVAGKAYDGVTLEPIPVSRGGEFVSMMRPIHPEQLDSPGAAKALECNRKTKAEILAAPDQGVVHNQFLKWVAGFKNTKAPFGGKPIAAGKNIRNFDFAFLRELNRLHTPKKEKTPVFSDRYVLDLEDFLFHWFCHDDTLPNIKMDTIREYFGMDATNGHDALCDCQQTGDLIMKFLRLYRNLTKKTKQDGSPFIPFKNSFAPKTTGAA